MKPQTNCQLNVSSESIDMDSAYKALEIAIEEFNNAEQKLFAARALCYELYKKSDPYKVQRQRQWDNRCEDDR